MNEYIKAVHDFCELHNIEVNRVFAFYGPHFEDEKEYRNVWNVTLLNKSTGKLFNFNFGDSLNNSWAINNRFDSHMQAIKAARKEGKNAIQGRIVPSKYDVLSCLQKYDIGSYSDFCEDFGYNEDSIKATEIYKVVRNEYKGFMNVFGSFKDSAIEQLIEIAS